MDDRAVIVSAIVELGRPRPAGGSHAIAVPAAASGIDYGPQLLRVAEAATAVGFSPGALSRAARQGRVPGARKVGGVWRFDPQELNVLPPSADPPTTMAASSAPAAPRRTRARRAATDSAAAIRGR